MSEAPHLVSLEAPAESEPLEGDPRNSPLPGWPWWVAPAALFGALVLTAVAALVVDLPAVALGANLTSSHTPAGLTIADTFVQDIAFVVASVYCARLAGGAVRSWQFGLRRPGVGWRSAIGMILLLIVAFILLDAVWSSVLHPEKEKLLKQLGSNESGLLLVLSAGLTCVVAPMCEEFLFRATIFTALRSWGMLPAALITGLVFGGVHATSAPIADLLPLGALGFGLCLLYRYSGSLYPGMAAHSLNNSIAFASLEGWGWQAPVLMTGALVGIWLVVVGCKRAGLIAANTGFPSPAS
jgi:uncharacterized protein